MRKTSFDGGDIVSITSGFDNENKKPITGILKTKRNSIKRKVQNFSLESDDGVIEPLLQKVKESTEIGNQSAKNLMSKTKTDSIMEKGDDKDKLLADKKIGMPSMTSVPSVTNNAYLGNGTNSVKVSIKSNGSNITPLHTYMYPNVISNNDALQGMSPPKTQILVEIESTKLSGYSPSPLIFTTAKIHTDGKSKQMEPVHVTPVPILSTIEGNIMKTAAFTDCTTNVNDTFRKDNEQNMQDNIFSKNQVGFAPCPRITNIISSDPVTKKDSLNKVIITSSTLIQVSQAPKPIDVKATDDKSVPLTSIINVTQSALLKSEQSNTKTSLTQIQEAAKLPAINVDTKSALEKTMPSVYSTKIYDSILTPVTSSANGINKTDNTTKVIEMDINKNIQSPKSVTSPGPGTSNQVDSSSTKTIPGSFGTDRITKEASISLRDKKIQSQKYETAERCCELDKKQTASNSNKTEKVSSSNVNSGSNLASNKSNSLNLKSCVTDSTTKMITPSITMAVSSVVSSISCSESSQAQTVATMSKSTAITKDSSVSVAKCLTTNDTITSSSNAENIMTTSANTNVSNSDKKKSVASTHTTSSASAVSRSLTVSTVKTPAATSQSSTTAQNMKTSVAKPLITNIPVTAAPLVKMTTTGVNSNVKSTIKSQPAAGTKSTHSVSPAVSKPATVSTAKTPVITSQSTTTASQISTKSTITSVKSTAASKMPTTSSAKIVAGSSFSTATKPSTVTTMKSSAGQKINTSATSKLATPKSVAAVVSTSSTIKKVPNEQNDKKASDGFSKDGKGSKA